MRAEKEINLIPAKHKTGNTGMILFTSISAGLIILAVILLFAYILPEVRINKLKEENAKKEAEINSIGDLDEALKRYEKKQSELNQMKDALEAIKKDKFEVLKFLKKLSSYIPENVFVSSLSFSNGDSLSISFVVSDPVDTARLIVKLREMDMFESVDVSSVPIVKGENTISFSLKIKDEDQG